MLTPGIQQLEMLTLVLLQSYWGWQRMFERMVAINVSNAGNTFDGPVSAVNTGANSINIRTSGQLIFMASTLVVI